MSQKHETWGWMLAFDFFFAGMGAAMLLFAGIAELFLGSNLSTLGIFAGAVFVGLGAGLLILELGRPFQALRVFMNPKAILTFGAWNMSIAIVAGLLLGSCWVETFPWYGSIALRKIMAIICVVTGLIVATYPGILLARHKGRPFWNGPGMLVIFLTSSLLTGFSAFVVCGWLGQGAPVVSSLFPKLAAALCAFQFVLWMGYLWIKNTGTTEREAAAAKRWISGNYAGPFRVGLMFLGTLVPMVLFLIPHASSTGIAGLLAILGGLLMRNLVVYAGQDRTWLPGEEKYRSRLPHGDEAFLQKVWTKQV
ncbi:NrfD/PsrC family molybdoenzyme membrane anchor subunit [Desulfitobacterium sp. PCE1]|uniref:NrfD/PsrC family molybdoenzyme membrane anchor subunit n=1 Tax=Desulfitobacterium sp. PCE1 TaxID=146907 RepID=UPI000365E3A1|nr:NrfD/PsrC family molybdoenzyme membrane anchor subunit [Desulfitobacterium sp. PCE1]